jgi:hypothetical protein
MQFVFNVLQYFNIPMNNDELASVKPFQTSSLAQTPVELYNSSNAMKHKTACYAIQFDKNRHFMRDNLESNVPYD